MPSADIQFYNESALLERLTTGVKRQNQSVIFLVGSPLTAPLAVGQPGVPNVSGVIDAIRNEFQGDQLDEFDKSLQSQPNAYQAAFWFLLGRRGQQAANEIIKRAVWKARTAVPTGVSNAYAPSANTLDETCRALDTDVDGWVLTPAVEALGRLVTGHPEPFGKAVLTTNFDPLIEVAILKSGGHFFRTVLHRDGNLGQTEGSGCHVIHLHGYWYGADTLHTPRQLTQSRPRLKASLSSLVKAKTVVILGYGGWDDTFTETLMEIVLDDNAFPEIIWTFNDASPQPSEKLISQLAPGLDRGRVTLYSGVDCHQFFPALLSRWNALSPPVKQIAISPPSSRLQSIVGSAEVPEDISNKHTSRVLEGDAEDRPPLTDICVGRDNELSELENANHRACFLTGFGGQGKSTLAAKYFSNSQLSGAFDLFVWRDCKEQQEKLEGQITDIIERLSNGLSPASALSNQPMDVLAQLLHKHSEGRKLLIVFDNVDHYVDLDQNKLTGTAHDFLSAFLKHPSKSRIVFTCRPEIKYASDVLSLNVQGLSVSAVAELFAKRGASASQQEIERAHSLTGGHAFWLDLIAAQVAKNSTTLKLKEILNSIAEGSGGALPASTLTSIWKTLHDRQKLVLQVMAETVRPETDYKVAEYLRGRLNFNQVSRALRALRDLNLIVVKPRAGLNDLLELHPLVREFIRQTFPFRERVSFIDSIMAVYIAFMGVNKKQKGVERPFSVLQHWIENAELCIASEKLNDAFKYLAEVRHDIYASHAPGEFARVARMLFRSVDWNRHSDYLHFDGVFVTYFKILVNADRVQEYEELIKRYESTIEAKDARYISCCALQCHKHWSRLEYGEAVHWGLQGKTLKDKTGIEHHDIEHELALAQRDSGLVDPALDFFLKGSSLDSVIDPEEFDENREPSYYGNIGRCLHLMGQIDPALVCYKKSALLLQKTRTQHAENQGFIRSWIGQLLLAKGEFCPAKFFLEAAIHKWTPVCPRRADSLLKLLAQITPQTSSCQNLSPSNAERYALAWIHGRENNFVPI